MSEVLGPVPLALVLCLVVGVRSAASPLRGMGWGLVAAGFAAVLPYIATWRVRHPRDGAPPTRSARIKYLAFTLAAACLGLALLAMLGAPHDLVAVAATIVIGVLVAGVLNRRWRLSNHVSAASGGVVMLAMLYGPQFLVLYAIPLLLAWARVQCKRHSTWEVLVGGLVGSVVAIVAMAALI